MAQETFPRLVAKAENGIEEIQRGKYYTNDEVFAIMQRRIASRMYEKTRKS